MFKSSNRQKNCVDCTVRTDADMAGAVRHVAGPCDMWQVLVGSWTMNHFLTHGIGGEWIGDTWPKQGLPRVTLAMV
jgi:hypothetical protein